MKLAANLSPSLRTLICQGNAPIDLIEIGDWFSLAEVQACQAELPGYPLLYHAGEQISAFSTHKSWQLDRLESYLRLTGTPWLSIHLTFMAKWRASLAFRGIRLPDLPAGTYAKRFYPEPAGWPTRSKCHY